MYTEVKKEKSVSPSPLAWCQEGIQGGAAMHMKKLLEKVAHLEFVNDQITAELSYVDKLLRSIGFIDGLKTVKSAALELYEQERSDEGPRASE